MAKKGQRPGRPKTNPAKKFTRRHVINITEETESEVQAFCDRTGFTRLTDGLRVLINKGLQSERKQ